MLVLRTKKEISDLVSRLKSEGKSIGFVPTMGALHKGHLSLVKESNTNNDITVVSIFVNPTQFNNPSDLTNYPRLEKEDLDLLEKENCDIVFIPEEKEIYPEQDTRIFNFGILDTIMEGKNRPGHFNGVGQVVSKLFEIVNPHNSYFGKKDFQQIAVIRELVRQLKYDINIVECKIIREEDGLAFSSRNLRLNEEQRKNAPIIYSTLKEAQQNTDNLSVAELKSKVINTLNNNKELNVEYFEIVDKNTLESVTNWDNKGKLIGCITVEVGKIRLIDNIEL